MEEIAPESRDEAERRLLRAHHERLAGNSVELDFQGAELSGLHLPGANLVGANLRGADLSGAVLAGAHLEGANLRDAILVGVSLDGADLTDADLAGADLAGARVDDAVLAGARLEGACIASLLGDALSFTGARLDRAAIERSDFTMRDIAQMVIRGAEVDERESAVLSIAPKRSIASQAAAPWEDDSPADEGLELVAPSYRPTEDGPSSRNLAEEQVGISAPVLPLIAFDEKLPPSVPLPEMPSSERAPSGHPSILPILRAAEKSSRLQAADSVVNGEELPLSMKRFDDLNALIESARAIDLPTASLRPEQQKVDLLDAFGFSFPKTGEEYLGAVVEEELPPGTISRCYRARNADGQTVLVRVFDPQCPGAALQLSSFQRGLRALSKLQGHVTPGQQVVELLAVAVDQTAYVVREYDGGNLRSMAEGSLSLQDALVAIENISRTVQTAHAHGVLVRVWRPENIIRQGAGLLLSEPDTVHTPTLHQKTGSAGPYAAYVAPEEILGRGTRSPTADVFSLGKLLEFLVTGQEPIVPLGSPPLIAQRQNVPEVLVELVKRATADDPMERYQSVGEFLSDVIAIRENGDRAALLASLRPQKVSRLENVDPLLIEPAPSASELEAQKRREQRAQEIKARKKKPIPWATLIGLVGGTVSAAFLLLLFFAPRSVDKMDTLKPFLAGGVALIVFAIPQVRNSSRFFRTMAWPGLAGALWLLDPLSYSHVVVKAQLASAAPDGKGRAVRSLARMGQRVFAGVDLSHVRLDGAELGNSLFWNSSLKSASFEQALLMEADFSGADISEANFRGANLFGAKLTHAKNLESAYCDRFTQLSRQHSCEKGRLSSSPQPSPSRRLAPLVE